MKRVEEQACFQAWQYNKNSRDYRLKMLSKNLSKYEAETMSLTMRALRLGQLSVKSASCYAATTLPSVARYHTPYNYHSLDKPKSLWDGLVYGLIYN